MLQNGRRFFFADTLYAHNYGMIVKEESNKQIGLYDDMTCRE